MLTVQELKWLLELEPACPEHGKSKVLKNIVTLLEELGKLSIIVCFFLSLKL